MIWLGQVRALLPQAILGINQPTQKKKDGFFIAK